MKIKMRCTEVAGGLSHVANFESVDGASTLNAVASDPEHPFVVDELYDLTLDVAQTQTKS